MRIALIDDDNTTNFINKTKLTKALSNVTVETFGNGKEILDYLNNNNESFDYAFLDLNMPVMNGLEFLSKHRVLDPSQKIAKIILFIEQKVDEDFIEKNELYMHITKPITTEKINLIFND